MAPKAAIDTEYAPKRAPRRAAAVAAKKTYVELSSSSADDVVDNGDTGDDSDFALAD